MTSPATPGRARCGSATEPSTSARTTSTARRLTRSCCTPDAASACPAGCGRSCRRRPNARPRSGASPTRASGRPAAIRGDTARQSTWGATSEEIKDDILTHGLTKDGVLRQHYDTDALDASNLLAAIFGFLPADDERLRASVMAIAEDLTEDGFVLRYRTDETDDGMSGKEGSFLICSFWLVSGLAVVGEHQRGRDLMEKLLRVASPLGLYAEEFDTSTAHFLGNVPQAFSHLALIEAAGRIILSEMVGEIS